MNKKSAFIVVAQLLKKMVSRIKKNIHKFALNPEDVGFHNLLNTNMQI